MYQQKFQQQKQQNWLNLCLEVMALYVTQNTDAAGAGRNRDMLEHFNTASNIFNDKMKQNLNGLDNSERHIFEKRMDTDLVGALNLAAYSGECMRLFATQAIDDFMEQLAESGMHDVIAHLKENVDGLADM